MGEFSICCWRGPKSSVYQQHSSAPQETTYKYIHVHTYIHICTYVHVSYTYNMYIRILLVINLVLQLIVIFDRDNYLSDCDSIQFNSIQF